MLAIRTPILVCLCLLSASLAFAEPKHGFAVLGKLKYPANFKHYDYADPKAPKGGEIVFWYPGSYDSLNPFILKGHKPVSHNPFINDARLLAFDTLMVASLDEPDSYYGLIAESVDIPANKSSATFTINPAARFHDGTNLTADDVVFTFNTIKAKGHPIFKVRYKDVEKAEIVRPRNVRFTFAAKAIKRDLPAAIAVMPVFSKAYYGKIDFTKTSVDPPLGNGAYRILKGGEGRTITYERIKDYWARNLGVNLGGNNFDRIKYIYFRDREVALEALFAGKLDFREEFTSRSWATKYNAPAVKDGRIIREKLPDASPSGFQSYYFNTRRKKFSNRQVRWALGLAFDFEWTNKNLFHGLYKRTYSTFQNTDLAPNGKPSPGELKLLEPYRGKVPPEVFGTAYRPPKTDGSGRIRKFLRRAKNILSDNGWKVKDGRLVDFAGEQMKIEFLSFSTSSKRIVAPYIQNLKRLGINGRFRLVDAAQYQKRQQTYDYDIITLRFSGGLTPGLDLKNLWHSASADVPGRYNYAGVKNPAIDSLLGTLMRAKNRTQLQYAARALDRVIMWNYYVTPQWNHPAHNIAYWDKFGRPKIKPKYHRGVLQYWWHDPAKAAKLAK